MSADMAVGCGRRRSAVGRSGTLARVTSALLPGVFVGSHAIAAGLLTRRQLRERSYRRLVHGVYADPSLEVDHRLRCTGVALLLPRGAAIAGQSAAAWHGAPFAGVRDPVSVVRPPAVLWKGPREVRVHQADLAGEDLTCVDDVRVTSAARTAWDVAALEPLGTAVAALDAMVRAGAVTEAQLAVLVANGAGRWGVVRVRRAFGLVDPRADSPPESRVRVALTLAGLAPVVQHVVVEQGRFLGKVDAAWPAQRVALEYDGAHHVEGTQVELDDVRYADLEAAGWLVVRVTVADLADLDALVERVRAVLATR
jgi:hypothetical protein